MGVLKRSERRKQEAGDGELPPEMLVRIFKHLKISELLVKIPCFANSLREEQRSILSAGAVNHHWRKGMATFLQNECLVFSKQWRPDWWTLDGQIKNPYCFPSVLLIVDGKVVRFSCPPFTQEGQFQNLTNSICFTGQGNIYGSGLPALLKFLSVRVGSQLQSITFFNHSHIPGRALQNILTRTKNLEALTLQDIKIVISNEEMQTITLPELKNLAYMRIWGVKELRVHNWVLEPYKSQLALLEVGPNFEWKGGDQNLPKVNWLKVDEPHPSIFQSELQFPALHSLSLRCRSGRIGTDFELLKQFLSKFAGSLVHLHLDFGMFFKSLLLGEGVQPALTFEAVKTLSIVYRHDMMAVKRVKLLLLMFPQLEELTFIGFNICGYPPRQQQIAKTVVKKHRYLDLCPKLKKIAVHAFGPQGATPLYEECAPFSL